MVAVRSVLASPSARPTPSPTVSPTTSPSASATANPSPPIACADRVLAAMTWDQLIGQLFELGLAGDRLGPTEINLIQADHIGSVWFVATTTAGVAGIAAGKSGGPGHASSE